MSPTPLKFQVSPTVSAQASTEMTAFFGSDPALIQGEPPKTQADWDQLSAKASAKKKPLSDSVAAKFGVQVEKARMGGVDVLRVTPSGYNPGERRRLIYSHGGGYVVSCAAVELTLPALLGTELGVEVISIDYTLAPRANYEVVTDQVVAVYRAVLEGGTDPRGVGMFGDSAGGGITLASALKLRDQGIPLPGALCLFSPSTDVSEDGDSRMSIGGNDSDPILARSAFKMLGQAYAPGELRNPYASPVHGDYTKPFPPTLIQGGTRELLLSDFVRFYQAMIQGGNEAVLDLYEGMCHVFQGYFPDVPETKAAVRRAGDFLRTKLSHVLCL